ncbi:PREDICTED: pentatricopeptide repeat-containing protein At4g21190 isoform X1 [Camelina sativa]|uniref:Pentatricopeptide repeat-containing protein At4g21190 isoform X1 n=2 Tax=Camelina sativa TaxID=90675 RepID=A0ABM0U0W4_CAMSA|nr:PREDICTED: pentatricopeptide repeat-containing protein At4g21190 isoform X1 [Camelina sativa]XP_010434220.1 PREDICTED: pentatricopeptide repeat-containing protein At4g21190 isoform X2 [Camelina sativa]XP_010434221.1 PREDICTED: pentatricopeptide repeat-containing protein At4g21190 isoform X3 [Camelina sativa]XP_010434222.1 PREDICTED: pentatricopeptide repeat-containing protein At4g21190 isoform X1 [Camelina sativa]
MLCLRYSLPYLLQTKESTKLFSKRPNNVVICAARGPRPRSPRVWKTRKRIGSISKAAKMIDCIKGLSNVKEEVYGALDSFIAWELEFPLVIVKKALVILEDEKEWKKIIQVTKWMLSKGQGRTMGTYFSLLNALAEDNRLDEAEELWNKLFMEHLEGTPRKFFNKMISIYYKRDMHQKLFEVFADMEELGVKPNVAIVSMVGKVFVKLGMEDKYEKLMKKYPPPQWEFRYIKGRRVKVKAKQLNELSEGEGGVSSDEDKVDNEIESKSKMLSDKEANQDGEDLSEEKEEEEEEEEEEELLRMNQGQIGISREPSLDYLDSS